VEEPEGVTWPAPTGCATAELLFCLLAHADAASDISKGNSANAAVRVAERLLLPVFIHVLQH
jgi:hypothetical protein